jgi:hypothetical protein
MKERIARNEAAFRRINEDIGRGRDTEDDITLVGFVCECGMSDCARLIEMTAAEYEHIRSEPTRFAVVEGHEILAVEAVVERKERYTIVEKQDEPGALARAADPRA